MCKGLSAPPASVADHISRHMIDILRVDSALARGRKISIEEIKSAHEAAKEVIDLLDHGSPTLGTPEERQRLESFLTVTEQLLSRHLSRA